MHGARCLLPLLVLGACAPEQRAHGLNPGEAAAAEAAAAGKDAGEGAYEHGIDTSVVYKGRRRLHGPLPDGADDAVRETTARVFFEQSPERGSVLHLMEEGSGLYRVRIDVPGRPTADGGWAGEDEETRIRIDRHGRLTGSGYDPPVVRIAFDGRMTVQRMLLRITFEATAADGPMPAGTRLVYDYALERDPLRSGRTGSADSLQNGAKREGDCKRIRWKLKNVMDYGSGTIDMVRVPVCEDQ